MFSFCSQKTLINSRKNAKYEEIMKKMRIFKFWNRSGDEKEKESMSLKKIPSCLYKGILRIKSLELNILVKKAKKS